MWRLLYPVWNNELRCQEIHDTGINLAYYPVISNLTEIQKIRDDFPNMAEKIFVSTDVLHTIDMCCEYL